MSEIHKGVKTFEAESLADWRLWLKDNCQSEKSVWLIIHKKNSAKHSFVISEAIDEALCFGWVDSKSNSRDADSYYVYFARRNPKSNWSRINKEKIQNLANQNRLTAEGKAMIQIAKETGTWDALNDVENLIIPDDLQEAFDRYKEAATHFENFPRSIKRGTLEWIFNAKRPATRAKRINETAERADLNLKPSIFKS